MNTFQNGIWSGLLATGPMTLAMFRMQESLPATEKSPLPPATLTSQITSVVGVDQKVSTKFRPDLTLLSHFSYGAAGGLLYSFLRREKVGGSPVLNGSLFGLGVWAASYMGWIPMFGLRASAYKMPVKRNALMVLSHLVWGASLGIAQNKLMKFGGQMLDGHRKAPRAE